MVRTRRTHAALALAERAQVRFSREFGLGKFSGIAPCPVLGVCRNKMGQQREGPTSARTIRVHRSLPSVATHGGASRVP